MSSNRIVTRCFAAAFVAAFIVVAALGCGSDEGNAPTEAATGNATTAAATGSADTGTATAEGIDSLQEAQAQLCSEVSDLEADLTEVSTSGTEAGQDVLERLGSGAAALEAGAATLRTAGADDAATAAEDLASRLAVALHVRRGGCPRARRRGGRRGAAAHGRSAVSDRATRPWHPHDLRGNARDCRAPATHGRQGALSALRRSRRPISCHRYEEDGRAHAHTPLHNFTSAVRAWPRRRALT